MSLSREPCFLDPLSLASPAGLASPDPVRVRYSLISWVCCSTRFRALRLRLLSCETDMTQMKIMVVGLEEFDYVTKIRRKLQGKLGIKFDLMY